MQENTSPQKLSDIAARLIELFESIVHLGIYTALFCAAIWLFAKYKKW
jgi:hypothetical protein